MAKANDTAAPAADAPVVAPEAAAAPAPVVAPVVAPVAPATDAAASGPVPASVAIADKPGTVEYVGQGGVKLTVKTN